VRLVERAWRGGERGVLPWLACFFKSPLGVSEQSFATQVAMLRDWVNARSEQPSRTAPR
jgi:myo-inositol-1-phosphate synthase